MRYWPHVLNAVLAVGAGTASSGDWVLYIDPAARFSVRYPRGWQVREDLFEGWVAFYREHPREGTSFLVFPRTTLPGHLGPDRAVRSALAVVAGLDRYQHFRLRHRVTPQGLGIFSVRGEAGWKSQGGRRRVRAAFASVLARPPVHGGDTQLFYLLLAQAPEEEWPRHEPVFLEILRDFKWTGG